MVPTFFIAFLCLIYLIREAVVDSFLPISPCPRIFRYHQLNTTGEWVGQVFIRPPPDMVLPIKLDVFLCLESILPTKYVGILELNKPRSVVLDRLSKFNREPIPYIVRFPLPSPLPTVTNISVNYNVVCVGHPVLGPVFTIIHLENTLFPLKKLAKKKTNINISNTMIRFGDIQPASNKDEQDSSVCGRPIGNHHLKPFRDDGKYVNAGEWPWLVAVFLSQDYQLVFHCSATLISEKIVITAGHCMNHEEYGQHPVESVVLHFGRIDIKNWTEQNVIVRQAMEIHIHPDFNSNDFSADIALVKFEAIRFTDFVKPACLWNGATELNSVAGKMGMVVGWRRKNSRSKLESRPRYLHIKIVSQEECLRSRVDFVYLTNNRTFCAGNRNGSGPCNGDSGAGILLYGDDTNRWELRGIASLSIFNVTSQSCDLNEYTIFTDMAKFNSWLVTFVV